MKFLVREVYDKHGKLQFRRYRILSTPWFSIYLHRLYRDDTNIDPHNHTWDFSSLVLWGSYDEVHKKSRLSSRSIGSWYKLTVSEFHRMKNVRGISTILVFAGKKKRDSWGYWVKDKFVDHKEYEDNNVKS
jgi:hypothetical protein